MNRLTSSLPCGARAHAVVLLFLVCALATGAQGGAAEGAADEAAVRENVRRMEEGWNAKSGALFASPFAEDADYVVINGTHLRGRAAIEEGHRRIFETVFKDSQLTLAVKQLRFLRPEVAVVHVSGRNKVGRGAEAREWEVMITLVMVRQAGAWKIAAFQNTQVAEGRRP